MTPSSFTIIDGGRATAVPATARDGRVRLPAEAVARALGWTLEPEGLCRAGRCIPLRPGSSPVSAEGIDLAELAATLGRPLALDVAEGAACLGASAEDRAEALGALEAPDFVLPDLDGRPHRLSDHRGKKVLLIAYASW